MNESRQASVELVWYAQGPTSYVCCSLFVNHQRPNKERGRFFVFLLDQPPHGPHGAWSVSWSAFNGTFSPNRQYRAIGVRNISRRAWGQERRIIRHAPCTAAKAECQWWKRGDERDVTWSVTSSLLPVILQQSYPAVSRAASESEIQNKCRL